MLKGSFDQQKKTNRPQSAPRARKPRVTFARKKPERRNPEARRWQKPSRAVVLSPWPDVDWRRKPARKLRTCACAKLVPLSPAARGCATKSPSWARSDLTADSDGSIFGAWVNNTAIASLLVVCAVGREQCDNCNVLVNQPHDECRSIHNSRIVVINLAFLLLTPKTVYSNSQA